jgi:hypothetical protein
MLLSPFVAFGRRLRAPGVPAPSGEDRILFDIPTDLQRLRTSERGVRNVVELLLVKSHVRQALHQFLQIDDHL